MRILKKKQAFAVILIISVIALLTVIAVGFIVLTRLDIDISFYSNESLRAVNLADAGIQRIIGEIQKDAKTEFIDDAADAWIAGYSDNTLLSGLGEYDVTAIDCQRQVNINNAPSNLLEELPGIDAALASAIIAARPYETKRQLMNVAGIAEGTYDNLKDYITVISWRDSSCSDRSPININTADEAVIRAVLKGTGLSQAAVDSFYSSLSSRLDPAVPANYDPFESWPEFDAEVDATSLSAAEKDLIKANANPNRVKPANNTTEFCFFSGGYYEITSSGTVYETTAQSKAAAARTINTVVQLFKTIYYTTKEDFRGEDANYNLSLDAGEDTNGNGSLDVPVYQRVTWMDSCPVNASSLFGSYSLDSPEYVPGALKIGYWDNFDEDTDYTQSQWIGDFTVGDSDFDPDNELYYATATAWPYPLFTLNDSFRWTWDYYTIRVNEYDNILPWQMKEVGWVMCGTDASSGGNVGIHMAYPGPLEWGGVYYRDIGGEPVISSNNSYPLWIFTPQLRRWPDNGDIDNYWSQHPDAPEVPAYDRAKTYNITNTSSWARAKCYDSTDGESTLDIPQAAPGRLTLYGQNQRPVWDDLRIISNQGSYTSITYNPPEGMVSWGCFLANYTLQANTSLSYYVDAGSGFSMISSNSPINAQSNSIRYKIFMASTVDMKNTPIAEDIYMTYIISAKTIYRKEN